MSDEVVTVRRGGSPLVLSMPHPGTRIVPEVAERLNETGLCVPDTDWWMARLYDFAGDLDATVVEARLSRYVIDLNRDPSGASLYPGQATTGLCPTTTFDGDPIYRPGMEPDEAEIARRRDAYFAPYHDALAAEIERARKRHGHALLYDCHSIRSVVPRLFAGTLPVFNIGTNGGVSCAPEIEAAVASACAAASGVSQVLRPHPEECPEGASRRMAPSSAVPSSFETQARPAPQDEGTGASCVSGQLDFSYVVNGRFKGGWITRHYGRPRDNVHAVQMELALRGCMTETPPWTYLDEVANRTRKVLRQALEAMITAGERLDGVGT